MANSPSQRQTWRLSPSYVPYLLVSPFLILFLVFGVFPLAFSFFLAFQTWEPSAGLSASTSA